MKAYDNDRPTMVKRYFLNEMSSRGITINDEITDPKFYEKYRKEYQRILSVILSRNDKESERIKKLFPKLRNVKVIPISKLEEIEPNIRVKKVLEIWGYGCV